MSSISSSSSSSSSTSYSPNEGLHLDTSARHTFKTPQYAVGDSIIYISIGTNPTNTSMSGRYYIIKIMGRYYITEKREDLLSSMIPTYHIFFLSPETDQFIKADQNTSELSQLTANYLLGLTYNQSKETLSFCYDQPHCTNQTQYTQKTIKPKVHDRRPFLFQLNDENEFNNNNNNNNNNNRVTTIDDITKLFNKINH